MPLDYLSELKESCAIAKSRSLTVTRSTKITEWKSAISRFFLIRLHLAPTRKRRFKSPLNACIRKRFPKSILLNTLFSCLLALQKVMKFYHIFRWGNFGETDTFPINSQRGNGNFRSP